MVSGRRSKKLRRDKAEANRARLRAARPLGEPVRWGDLLNKGELIGFFAGVGYVASTISTVEEHLYMVATTFESMSTNLETRRDVSTNTGTKKAEMSWSTADIFAKEYRDKDDLLGSVCAEYIKLKDIFMSLKKLRDRYVHGAIRNDVDKGFYINNNRFARQYPKVPDLFFDEMMTDLPLLCESTFHMWNFSQDLQNLVHTNAIALLGITVDHQRKETAGATA